MKVSVLAVRSYTVGEEDLAAVQDELRASLAARGELETVDAARALFTAGSPRWKEADQLFFTGVNEYGELKYPEAVDALRASLKISSESYREYSGLEGLSRVRETCLYLGLARLEQGASDDATSWFLRAARAEPTFRPDEKEFSPKARKAWAEARASLTGAPMDTSLEQLSPIAERIGAQVIVTAGVNVAADGHASLQLVMADMREHTSTEKSIVSPSASRDDLVRAVKKAAPEIMAQILHEDPHPNARRIFYTAGVESRYTPAASVTATISGGLGFNRYTWSSALLLGGVTVGVDGLAWGRVVILPALGLLPPQPMRGSFTITPNNVPATAEVLYGFTPRVYAIPSMTRDRWTFGAGAGGEATLAVMVMRSSQSVAVTTYERRSAAAIVLVRRSVGRRGTVQGTAGVGYDLGSGPGRVTWRAGLVTGTTF